MSKKNNLSYNEAFERLEQLVFDIEDDSLMLDVLANKVKEANELIQYCEDKLRHIEAEVEKVSTAKTKPSSKSKKQAGDS